MTIANVETLSPRQPRKRKAIAAELPVTPAISPPDPPPLPTLIGEPLALVLGQLTGVVAGVQSAVSELKEDVRRERDDSAASRRRLHEKVDDLKDHVHEIDLKVGSVLDIDARLSRVEAEVANTRRIREWATHLFSRGWKIGIGIGGITSAGAAMWFWKQLGVLGSRIYNLFM